MAAASNSKINRWLRLTKLANKTMMIVKCVDYKTVSVALHQWSNTCPK